MQSETIVAIGQLITSIALCITAVGGIIIATRKLTHIDSKVTDVQTQVTTINSKTLAQQSDANETRRIELIPAEERTAGESAHLADSPPVIRPGDSAGAVAG